MMIVCELFQKAISHDLMCVHIQFSSLAHLPTFAIARKVTDSGFLSNNLNRFTIYEVAEEERRRQLSNVDLAFV
jgi:hypothetical protein